jgi:hypothetical protein
MSDYDFIQGEQRSSVKIGMTAKGEAVPEVKVYAGTDEAEMERIRQLAIATYNATAREVRVREGDPS